MSVTIPTIYINNVKDIITIKSKIIENVKDRWCGDYYFDIEKDNLRYIKMELKL